MRKPRRARQRGGRRLPLRQLALLAAAFLCLRGVTALGADRTAAALLDDLLSREGAAEALLALERGAPAAEDAVLPLLALLRESPLQTTVRAKTPATPASAALTAAVPLRPVAARTPPAEPETSPQTPEPTPEPSADAAALPSPVYVPSAEGILLRNRTDYEIDAAALLAEPLSLRLGTDGPQLLIIHTHSSESYTPDGDDQYEESDPSRTEDRRFNVIRVGDELAAALEARGFSVVHDRELYDYPTYTGAYSRSMAAISAYLEQYPSIRMVIDVHRDAIADKNGNYYRTVAEVDGETCAQVMLVMGSNFSGLQHPQWQENLKLALHLQSAMVQKYPGLARPLVLSQYRYNQHATAGSMILEVGSNGNTLQEALTAVRCFADAACDVLAWLTAG